MNLTIRFYYRMVNSMSTAYLAFSVDVIEKPPPFPPAFAGNAVEYFFCWALEQIRLDALPVVANDPSKSVG